MWAQLTESENSLEDQDWAVRRSDNLHVSVLACHVAFWAEQTTDRADLLLDTKSTLRLVLLCECDVRSEGQFRLWRSEAQRKCVNLLNRGAVLRGVTAGPSGGSDARFQPTKKPTKLLTWGAFQ